MELTVTTPLTQLPGIGEARGKKLEKLGLRQAGDFLHFFPKNYEDRRKVWTIRTAPLEGKCCIQAGTHVAEAGEGEAEGKREGN